MGRQVRRRRGHSPGPTCEAGRGKIPGLPRNDALGKPLKRTARQCHLKGLAALSLRVVRRRVLGDVTARPEHAATAVCGNTTRLKRRISGLAGACPTHAHLAVVDPGAVGQGGLEVGVVVVGGRVRTTRRRAERSSGVGLVKSNVKLGHGRPTLRGGHNVDRGNARPVVGVRGDRLIAGSVRLGRSLADEPSQ